MIVGELGCRRCRNVVEMGRTPNGDNMSEKREVQARRITLSEVRTVGEMGCRRSEVDPLKSFCPDVRNFSQARYLTRFRGILRTKNGSMLL